MLPQPNAYKYNTLTLAEAKKLNRFIKARPPARTASVRHKPRPPPILVTNLDDSGSNFSSRSSLDIVDSAYGSDRLQTMSVDLGQPSQHYMYCGGTLPYKNFDTCDPIHRDLSTKLSDESYSSAKSHQSDTSKLKSLSKASLSASTSKVFHNHLYSLKKFFRNLPTRRSIVNNDGQQVNVGTTYSDKPSLAESVSQICLNRSQSPPVCPPPPGELKSMSYMESSNVNYSNYDDFTRARNQQTSTLLNNYAQRHSLQQTTKDYRNSDSNSDSPDSESWHLASLPVSYERNLATVFEEKQNSTDDSQNPNKSYIFANNNDNNVDRHLIKPPANFDDRDYVNLKAHKQHSAPHTNSSQSLNSITTVDSILDFHRPVGTPYGFTYAPTRSFEPNANSQTNSGLPPRMPINGDTTKQVNPSNLSSINHVNNCDHRGSNVHKANRDSISDYTTATNILDNDADTTIVSDTSTINGDLNNLTYKCAELQRTVDSLKNKLISKEKELTDLQLKQWSSDYAVDQLRSTIGRLEKENAHLKAVLENVNKVNL